MDNTTTVQPFQASLVLLFGWLENCNFPFIRSIGFHGLLPNHTRMHFIANFSDSIFFQAEEITLTIGQAFELAYKKFLDDQGKDLEVKKTQMILQKRIEILEHENKELKRRLKDVAAIKGEADVASYLRANNVSR